MSSVPEIKRFVIVNDNNVTNVVLWDGETEYAPDGTLIDVTDEPLPIGPGWGYDGSEWIEPLAADDDGTG
jgi:hypothetical protein